MPAVVDMIESVAEVAREAAIGLAKPVGDIAIVVAPQDVAPVVEERQLCRKPAAKALILLVTPTGLEPVFSP